jgi:hypothetical protein
MKKEFIEKLTALITAAFGLVAALAWNDTIKVIFKEVFGEQSTVPAMITYAIIVTVIAVIVTLWISKIAEKAKKISIKEKLKKINGNLPKILK